MIYLDHAATTPLRPEVLEAMMPYLTENYGNASSLYQLGQKSRIAVETARRQTASAIGAGAQEILFTSGGTESDNWALTESFPDGKGQLFISAIEHPAILKTAEALEKQGITVYILPVTAGGMVMPEKLREALVKAGEEGPKLVSIMTVNNELGTVQRVRELAAISHKYGAVFHTDAVQAIGKVPFDVQELDVDMASFSGHKFGGPKGTGALYIRKNVELPSLIRGGEQERGRRAGTENVAGIVGLSEAMTMAMAEQPQASMKLLRLESVFRDFLATEIPDAQFNGDSINHAPGYMNVSFSGVEGEALLVLLDLSNIAVSVGSACASGSVSVSHVLKAIHLEPELAKGTIRITLGPENTEEEMVTAAKELGTIVRKLRKLRA